MVMKIKKFIVKPGKKMSLKDFDPSYTGKHVDHAEVKRALARER